MKVKRVTMMPRRTLVSVMIESIGQNGKDDDESDHDNGDDNIDDDNGNDNDDDENDDDDDEAQNIGDDCID